MKTRRKAYRVKNRTSRKIFRRTASKLHKANLGRTVARGGIRF